MEHFQYFSHLQGLTNFETVIAIEPREDYQYGGVAKTMVTIRQEKNRATTDEIQVPLKQLKQSLKELEEEVEE